MDFNDAIQLTVLAAIALIIATVVSERQQAEAALAAANSALRETDRAKDQLIANISHELRTPATVILGWIQLLRTNPELLSTALPAIDAAARAQSELIGDMLDMSRLILGKLRLDTAPVALVSIVQSCVNMAEPAARKKGIELTVKHPPDPLVVDGDAVRLQQVCWNLLSNAVKFTPEGGRVSIALAQRDEFAELSVTDNGQGISPELLPHVFEPLRQGDGGLAKGGLGLGLAIVQQLVAMHRGTVEATSAGPGKGARFVVRLPLSGSSIAR